jgi:glycosyltransferase involved in cell wall biosynthesis
VITVMHVVDLPGENPWLNGVADHHDRSAFRHLVAAVGSRNELQPPLEARGVTTYALESTSRATLPLAVARLTRLLRREHVDIVQTHLFDPTTVGLLAGMAARTPARLLTRHHADFTTMFHKPLHRRIDRRHALSAHRVLSPSRYIRDCMVRDERVPTERISVIPHGFDFDLLRPRLTDDERRQARTDLGGDGRVLIASLARLSVEKNHATLLEAVQQVATARPEVLFLLAGAGPLRGELEARARQLGIEGNVSFLGWRRDPWRLVEASDLVVHPGLAEPFGIVFVEAMALERAVVAHDDGAGPEIIDHGESGLLVPPRQPDVLARALLEVIDDPERRTAMGKTARQRVVERFSFPNIMRRYEELYVELLAPGRVGAARGRS